MGLRSWLFSTGGGSQSGSRVAIRARLVSQGCCSAAIRDHWHRSIDRTRHSLPAHNIPGIEMLTSARSGREEGARKQKAWGDTE